MDVITTHQNADFDAVGSMIAAKKLYPEAMLVFSGGEEKSLRDFFIQSTLYSLDLGALKSVNMEQITRLIIVDTRRRDRIGKFAEILDKPDLEIHIYDHHPQNEDDIRGTVEVIERSGSCVAIMTNLLRDREIEILESEATIMALGIYEDTGSLTFTSTTPNDLRAAAYLLERGADLSTVADIMARTLTAEQIFVLADLIKNTKKFNFKGHKVTITEADIDGYKEDLAMVVNRMRDIQSVDAVVALIRSADRIHLIARSRVDDIDVSRVAKHFGGGGHPSAAAATIKDMTLIQAREALQGALYSILRTPQTAASLMAYPVKTVTLTQPLEQASEMMNRYNVNVVPVMDGDQPVGYITRAVAERARHHGLVHEPVQEYMTADVITAAPDTKFSELYDMVVGRKQRVVPVLENGVLVGVVTRTDILNHMLDERTMGAIRSEEKQAPTRPAHFRDLKGLLRDGLPDHLHRACKTIGQVAEQIDMKAYLVGGFVRDLILRRKNLDLDIVVEGNGIELADKAAAILGGRVVAHVEFKTAVLVLPDETKIDFATARLEYYEYPAAMPIVEASSIKLDMYRRDFTINTLIIGINPDPFGELIDFFGAYQDLKDGQIRVLHNLSFIEDPTRVMRAVRFEQRFGFAIGSHTLKLLKSAVKSGFLKRVEGKRIFSEMKQVFEEEEPLDIILRLHELKIITDLDPKLKLEGKKERLLEEMVDVLKWFDLLYLDERIERWRVWLFALVGKLKNSDSREMLKRLQLPPRTIEEFMEEKEQAEIVLHKLSRQDQPLSNSQVFRICSQVGTEALLLVMAKSTSDQVRKNLGLYLTSLKKVRIEIGGFDLLKMGFKPGPVFSKILDAALDARLDNLVSSRDQEIAYIREKYSPEKKPEE